MIQGPSQVPAPDPTTNIDISSGLHLELPSFQEHLFSTLFYIPPQLQHEVLLLTISTHQKCAQQDFHNAIESPPQVLGLQRLAVE